MGVSVGEAGIPASSSRPEVMGVSVGEAGIPASSSRPEVMGVRASAIGSLLLRRA
jgi:hypothetical protein